MEWLGRATLSFTQHHNPLTLTAQDDSKITLPDLCRDSTPPCHLNPFLFNGNLQTCWTSVSKEGPEIYYKRKIFNADHHSYKGTFAVDFVVPPHEEVDDTLPPRTAFFKDGDSLDLGDDKVFQRNIGTDDTKPLLIVLHGLSGGSYEVYLRHAIAPLLIGMDKGKSEWECCVINSRGCAMSKITSGVLFNARATWDTRQVVKWARKTFPNRPLYGLGFSLGANIMTNYVGEEGSECLLSAAVVVGSPFNLEVAHNIMQQSLVGRELYQRVMGTNLKKLFELHKDSLLVNTKLDYDAIQNVTYLYEFDRQVQCATWGYPTESAYYRDASSCDSVLAIRIPFFAVQAKDDPIAVEAAIPYQEFEQNPYTVCCTSSLGGHLAFFELGGGRWHAKPVSNFLRNVAKTRVSVVEKSNESAKSRLSYGAHFDPMRRRMDIRGPEDQE